MNLGSTFYIDFIISDPTTGAPTDADDLPIIDVFEDDNDTPMYEPLSVKRVGWDGHYRVKIEATTANGFEEEKTYSVSAIATVGGNLAKSIIKDFTIENMKTKIAALLNDQAPSSFEPDMTDFPEPVVMIPMDDIFGSRSVHEFRQIFIEKYNQVTKTWALERTAGEIPASLRADVLLYQLSLDVVAEEQEEWEREYDVQKNVQWRNHLAEKLIVATA